MVIGFGTSDGMEVLEFARQRFNRFGPIKYIRVVEYDDGYLAADYQAAFTNRFISYNGRFVELTRPRAMSKDNRYQNDEVPFPKTKLQVKRNAERMSWYLDVVNDRLATSTTHSSTNYSTTTTTTTTTYSTATTTTKHSTTTTTTNYSTPKTTNNSATTTKNNSR
jgi:hypothetical protein